jgi:hypothetical protein
MPACGGPESHHVMWEEEGLGLTVEVTLGKSKFSYMVDSKFLDMVESCISPICKGKTR